MKECLKSNSGLSSLRILIFIMSVPIMSILFAITFKIIVSDSPDYGGMAALAGSATSTFGVLLGAKAWQKKYESDNK